MNKEALEVRLDRLTDHIARLAKRVELIEQHAGRQPAPATHGPEVRAALPPWKMDAASVEALVDEMYTTATTNPLGALHFETPPQGCYLSAHCKNVSKLAMFLAARHGLSEASIRTVGICGLLHDAGMDCLGHDLASSTRPLTQEEYQQVRIHPVRGAEYIRKHYRFGSLLSSVIPKVVEQHHERADGTGYPYGLTGGRIHDFARLLAIADSYEAMTTRRPFRAPLHPAEAMRTLLVQGCRSPRGGMYDRAMLKTFVWSTSLYPIGCQISLSDGREARVISATGDPRRPVVRLLASDAPVETIDLTRHEELAILS